MKNDNIHKIAQELTIKENQITKVLELTSEGNTIPFRRTSWINSGKNQSTADNRRITRAIISANGPCMEFATKICYECTGWSKSVKSVTRKCSNDG